MARKGSRAADRRSVEYPDFFSEELNQLRKIFGVGQGNYMNNFTDAQSRHSQIMPSELQRWNSHKKRYQTINGYSD